MSQNYQSQLQAYEPKIGINTFVAATWTLYALAIVSVAIRAAVTIRTKKPLCADFYLLTFALACLTASTIWIHLRHKVFYTLFSVDAGTASDEVVAHISELVHLYITGLFVYLPLTWTTIFAAKFAYLCFFKKLIDRIKPLTRYWWTVCIFTTITYILCLMQPFVLCPWTDDRAMTCAIGSRFYLSLHYAIAMMCLDVMTDIMIVSMAVCILWKIEIRTSQKFGLGMFLCMSIIVAVITIIRVSKFLIITPTGDHIYDTPWSVFWHQIEASLAITLVSSTAFRMFFVARKHRRQSNERKWYSSASEKLRRTPPAVGPLRYSRFKLPSIPSATISGLRTLGRCEQQPTSSEDTLSTYSSHESLSDGRPASQIIVAKSFEIHVEENLQQDSRSVEATFVADQVVHPTLRHKLSNPRQLFS